MGALLSSRETVNSMMTMEFVLLLGFIFCAFAAASSNSPPTKELSIHSGLRIVDNHPWKSILDRAQADAVDFGKAITLPMKYGIFQGKSSIRNLSDDDMDLLRPSKYGIVRPRNVNAFYRAAACLLCLRGNLEAAHETILGVTPNELDDAEYAAMHPGTTNWSEKHPLSDSADRIHSIIHRLEGPALGEGNYTGYENSKYWALGGPKKLESPALHPVRMLSAERAKTYSPNCLKRGVIAECDEEGNGPLHCIIAGGGKTRIVQMKPGEWDDIAFINICSMRAKGKLSKAENAEVEDLQRAELLFMLKNELVAAGSEVNVDEN